MPNDNLKNRTYDVNDSTESYDSLAMKESRLNKAKDDCENNRGCQEFERLGGANELKKISGIIHKEQDADYRKKKVGMDAGRENQFIKKHEKDRDNANPTGVGGVPKMNKGSVNRKIMTNKEVYNEGLTSEISEIKYLIEYMNNDKKTKI